MKNYRFYAVPKTKIDHLRYLLSRMQMAIDEVFEDDYLAAKLGSKELARRHRAPEEGGWGLDADRSAPPSLSEIF